MTPYSDDVRKDVATRLSGGQPPGSIAAALGIPVRTIYRIRRNCIRQGRRFIALPLERKFRKKISREQLLLLSEIVKESPKITLAELRAQAVASRIFESTNTAPHQATIYRRLRKVGFRWQKPRYSDPRAKRGRVRFERCCFRKAQQNGLDPDGKILSMDESNFYYEQATRAWGTMYKPAVLEKPKGKVMRRTLFATIGFSTVGGEPKAFIHWLLVPPRKSYAPLPDRIQDYEITDPASERAALKQKYTAAFVNGITSEGLKRELKELRIRSPATSTASMREVLLRVGRNGSKTNELRMRKRGRPNAGGVVVPPTGDAYMVSEYLYEGLGTYLDGQDLHAGDQIECKYSADLGIKGCPDGGKREFRPAVRDMTLMWDNAPSHLPTTSNTSVSPFTKWCQDKLGLRGLIQTPPYSPWFNPVELFFAYVKQYCRKFAPPDTPALLQRIREATAKVSGVMIQNWFKKCGFKVGVEKEPDVDPNEGVEDRCSLPRRARFQRREHIACADSSGKIRREKKSGHTRWTRYDDDSKITGTLQNVSVAKRSGVRRRSGRRIQSCPEPDNGKAPRWVGLSPEPSAVVHADYSQLYGEGSMSQVERVVDKRTTRSGVEYLLKWRDYDDAQWVPEGRIHGLEALLDGFDRGRVDEEAKIQKNKKAASASSSSSSSYIPSRAVEVGDVVAIKSPSSAPEPFYVAKVLSVRGGFMSLHWWSSKKIDGSYSPDFRIPQGGPGKGHGGPYTQSNVSTDTVIDRIVKLQGKSRGKIPSSQLKEILKLVRAQRTQKRRRQATS